MTTARRGCGRPTNVPIARIVQAAQGNPSVFADFAVDPRSWTRIERNARIERLRRVPVSAPAVLYTRVYAGVTYDVVWDGSLRAPFPCAVEPVRVD